MLLSYREQFNIGRRSLLDVLDAQNTRYNVQAADRDRASRQALCAISRAGGVQPADRMPRRSDARRPRGRPTARFTSIRSRRRTSRKTAFRCPRWDRRFRSAELLPARLRARRLPTRPTLRRAGKERRGRAVSFMHWLDAEPSREIDPVLDCLTFLAREADRPSSPVLLRAGLALADDGHAAVPPDRARARPGRNARRARSAAGCKGWPSAQVPGDPRA